jgi:hypothetical protein
MPKSKQFIKRRKFAQSGHPGPNTPWQPQRLDLAKIETTFYKKKIFG